MNDKVSSAWITSDAPPAYEVINPDGQSRVILVCDHASNRIPKRLGTLGLESADLIEHIAWDLGTAVLGERLAERLDAPLLVSNYSRLVVDCNRPLNDDAFPSRSECTDIRTRS